MARVSCGSGRVWPARRAPVLRLDTLEQLKPQLLRALERAQSYEDERHPEALHPGVPPEALLEGLLQLYPRVATWASDNPLKQHTAPLELRMALLGALVEAIGDPRLSLEQPLSSPWAMETLGRVAYADEHRQAETDAALQAEARKLKNGQQPSAEFTALVSPACTCWMLTRSLMLAM